MCQTLFAGPVRPRSWLLALTGGCSSTCPGFGQDRVNFHWNPGRDTAGRADPTWPNRAGYSIPCAITLGSGGGERVGGNSLTARESAASVRESGSLGCVVRVVLSPYLCLLLFLFPLFAVLLNCPYPDPPVSACFFPFFFAPWRGERWPRGAFVAGHSQTITVCGGLVAITLIHIHAESELPLISSSLFPALGGRGGWRLRSPLSLSRRFCCIATMVLAL